MQCFMCVTYLLLWGGAGQAAATPARRSLFRDVLQSLYAHAHGLAPRAPHDLPPAPPETDNHLTTADTRPSQPRRNDRLEEPPLAYRLPKSLTLNDTNSLKDEEIVVFIDTTAEPKRTTQRPKRQKRPKPVTNKLKQNEPEEDVVEEKPETTLTNTMAGASQIGNRESQMVIKPTVIVNVRGTVSHRDSDIRLESRKNEANDTKPDTPLNNVFNINQRIKIERTAGEDDDNRSPNKVLQDIKIISETVQPRVEDDMMMCETGAVEKEVRQDRQYDNVLQILFNIEN